MTKFSCQKCECREQIMGQAGHRDRAIMYKMEVDHFG